MPPLTTCPDWRCSHAMRPSLWNSSLCYRRAFQGGVYNEGTMTLSGCSLKWNGARVRNLCVLARRRPPPVYQYGHAPYPARFARYFACLLLQSGAVDATFRQNCFILALSTWDGQTSPSPDRGKLLVWWPCRPSRHVPTGDARARCVLVTALIVLFSSYLIGWYSQWRGANIEQLFTRYEHSFGRAWSPCADASSATCVSIRACALPRPLCSLRVFCSCNLNRHAVAGAVDASSVKNASSWRFQFGMDQRRHHQSSVGKPSMW